MGWPGSRGDHQPSNLFLLRGLEPGPGRLERCGGEPQLYSRGASRRDREADHAEQLVGTLFPLRRTRRVPGFGNREEQRIITGPEAKAAGTLGETPRNS